MSEFVTYHVMRFLHAIEERFTFATGYRGSLFLLAGGLFLLAFLILYVIAKSFFGRAQPVTHTVRARQKVLVEPRSPPEGATLYVPEGESAYDDGALDGSSEEPASLDAFLDRVHAHGLGDPRILGSTPRGKHIRLHGCAACRGFAGQCDYAAGFLAGGFMRLVRGDVHVVEIACTRGGDHHCEFEVTYA